MRRRDFFKYSAALGATSLFREPGFRTKHLVVVIYGGGARKKDVIGNVENAPHQSRMVREGTLFTEDYGGAVGLHGYLHSELLTGVESKEQRPRFPTWNEYVRKKTGSRASDFWVLQGVSFYRGFTFDVKNFSRHPAYGMGAGATSLTMNKLFREEDRKTPRELVGRFLEEGLGHTARERRDIEGWLADVLERRSYLAPAASSVELEVQRGDVQALTLAPQILRAFKPKLLTVQVLGLDEAHEGVPGYFRHLKVTDELIGNLWAEVQADPYLRETTALLVRPDGGRDDDVDPYGRLGHSPGSYSAHYVWTMALGPDFKRGHVVTGKVERRDLAPTVTYLMSGGRAEYSNGRIRTELFLDS
jgi:hypothetical protein